MVGRLRAWAEKLKNEVITLWFCARHPGTPFVAKALAAALVAYALSPIDLIPDFIPVLGLLDDLLILPLGVWLVIKLIPDEVMTESRMQAARWIAERKPKPRSRIGSALIIVLVVSFWLAILWMGWRWLNSQVAY